MTEKTQKKIYVQWVRSGIGFTRLQKGIVRSLGLSRLNQVVERQDTPQIRGLVGSIPHMAKIVPAPVKPAWLSVPEYTIYPPDPSQAAPARRAKAKPDEAVKAAMAGEPEKTKAKEAKAATKEHVAPSGGTKKPAKAAGKAKAVSQHATGDAKKAKASAKSKPAKKTKK
jgi:large subunit ribosomal protein L30